VSHHHPLHHTNPHLSLSLPISAVAAKLQSKSMLLGELSFERQQQSKSFTNSA